MIVRLRPDLCATTFTVKRRSRVEPRVIEKVGLEFRYIDIHDCPETFPENDIVTLVKEWVKKHHGNGWRFEGWVHAKQPDFPRITQRCALFSRKTNS